MKDFDWRKRYAPHGYSFIRRRILFDTLERAYYPQAAIENTIEEMHRKMANDCPFFFDPSLAHTRVSVFPKEIGESINHLDRLKPRFGIEIEIRQPMRRAFSDHRGVKS